MTAANDVVVTMGDFAVVSTSGVMSALGLGSCVAVVLYDRQQRIGGVAHVMLPSFSLSRVRDRPARSADTAVPWLIDRVCDRGANAGRIEARLVGGATMFTDLLPSGTIHIGERNVQACQFALRQAGIPVTGEAVGGTRGRSMWFDVATGVLTVRETGGEPTTL